MQTHIESLFCANKSLFSFSGLRSSNQGSSIKQRKTTFITPGFRVHARNDKQSGFTLIELLVVVLIIGILAAVAVPQYQVAVAKARFQQVKIAAESLHKAQKVYYLANGSYPTDFESLDISLGKPRQTNVLTVEGYGYQTVIGYKWGLCSLASYGNRIQCSSSYANVPTYTILGDRHLCQATKSIAYQVCASETGDKSPRDTGAYKEYRYP